VGDKKHFGNLGEDFAVKLLKSKGYKIIDRNFRTKFGEIDIVAIDCSTHSASSPQAGLGRKSRGPSINSGQSDYTLVFVEVKTRHNRKYGKPEEAVTPRKIFRIRKAGEYYLLTHKNLPKKLRIDVVAIEADGGVVTSAKIIKVT
jgi:putative endonuclease